MEHRDYIAYLYHAYLLGAVSGFEWRKLRSAVCRHDRENTTGPAVIRLPPPPPPSYLHAVA